MRTQIRCCLVLLCLVCFAREAGAQSNQTAQSKQTPVVVSVRMVKGTAQYRVDKKVVEDTGANSLQTNLEGVASAKGLDWPITILVDVNAHLTEIGKLKAAVDKVEFSNYTMFVGDFQKGTMEELRWGPANVPIPDAAR